MCDVGGYQQPTCTKTHLFEEMVVSTMKWLRVAMAADGGLALAFDGWCDLLALSCGRDQVG